MGNGIILSPTTVLKSRLKAERVNLVLMLLGFAPLLVLFFTSLWNRSTYQFFPLALVGSGLLGWRVIKEQEILLTPARLPSIRLLSLTVVLLFLLAYVAWSPWLLFVAFLAALMALLWGMGGKPLLLAFLPALLVLLAILPPPFSFDQTITLWLRSLAMSVCCSLLDCFQVNYARDGNTMQLPGKQLFVEEACSGINSFILCNVLCLFWLLWQRRPLLWLVLALPVTSLFVILGNIIRITSGAVAYFFWRFDLLSGWKHETFGLFLLLSYCALIWSLEQLLVFLFFSVTSRARVAKGPPPPPSPSPAVLPAVLPAVEKPLPSLFGFGYVGGVLLLICLSSAAYRLHHLGAPKVIHELTNFRVASDFKLTLPQKLGDWERLNEGGGDLGLIETLGVHSVRWRFQYSGVLVGIAVDYPLDGFHDVAMCYRAGGWQVLSESKLLNVNTGEDLHGLKLMMQQSLRQGEVFQSVVDAQGAWLAPTSGFDSRFDVSQTTGFRIQLVVQSYAPLSAVSETSILALFVEARKLLIPQIVGEISKSKN